MTILRTIDGFFFKKISAQGFGLMRMTWGAVIFFFMLFQWPDVHLLYANSGFVDHDTYRYLAENVSYWNIFDYVHSDFGVRLLYIALLISSACTMLGISCRLSTILTFMLYASITERGWITLLGGHTVTKIVGVLLVVTPNLTAFSIDRLLKQWHMWKQTRKTLAIPSMSIWIWRLLLFQVVCIYFTGFLEKVVGITWTDGTAVTIAMHNTIYSTMPDWLLNNIAPFTVVLTVYTMVFEGAWILLLIPARWMRRITKNKLEWETILRFLIWGGIFFHLGIQLFMDIGHFSMTMVSLLLGLFLLGDFNALRSTLNRKWGNKKIHILYDDQCKLCRRTTFILVLIDFLHRLDLVDFHHEEKRAKVDPHLRFEDLDKAMHIKIPDGKVYKGFPAIRELTSHIPLLWPLYPVLHLPGISHAGHKVYEVVAHNRKKCTGDNCEI